MLDGPIETLTGRIGYCRAHLVWAPWNEGCAMCAADEIGGPSPADSAGVRVSSLSLAGASAPALSPGDTGMADTIGAAQLRAFIERIETLEEEKRAVADQIKEVMAEAKGAGFDVKTIRKIVALRKKSQDERDEEAALLDLYMGALGMLADTPLGQAAVAREFGARPAQPMAFAS